MTREHFIASVEMQISGEPFAEAMGRSLSGFSRDYVCRASTCSPSVYHDPTLNGGVAGGRTADLAGFSAAVESYEYSKQPMNNVAFESGAGTSLAFGPVLNPGGATGARALPLLRTGCSRSAGEANARALHPRRREPHATRSGGPGSGRRSSRSRRWSPASTPTNSADRCSISSDDDPGSSGTLPCDDYECDYTTLHLPNRTGQVNMTITPGASGWAGWKEALWVLNYLQVMHDSNEAPMNDGAGRAARLVASRGQHGRGSGGPGPGGPGHVPRVERHRGISGGEFPADLDNQAQHWLTR